jgi:hypothetical protein
VTFDMPPAGHLRLRYSSTEAAPACCASSRAVWPQRSLAATLALPCSTSSLTCMFAFTNTAGDKMASAAQLQ